MPNNYYGNGGSDTWVYNLTGENGITLKPEQHARYGKLVINKTLLHQNVTSGDKATFVFQIDIENPDGTKESKVEALDFKTAGSDSITSRASAGRRRRNGDRGLQRSILQSGIR